MSDQSRTNGAAEPAAAAEEPRQSLREIAEAAWDEVSAEGEPEGGEPAPVDEGAQPRDAQGRFVPKSPEAEPGEAEPAPAPSPETTDQTPRAATPADPAQGSNQPPQHWPETARQMFATLPPEGQAFLLERHTEMERDYQAKAQANATAVQFTSALAPVFTDPTIAGSLQQQGLSPYEAILSWAGFQRRALSPDRQERLALWQELGQRMGLDPAADGQMSQPGPQLSEEDRKDPAIRYFADYLGKAFNDVQALRGELHQMRQQDANRQSAETLKVTRWGIDSFAEEKDSRGNPAHPHFDAVLPQIIELFRANPERDLKEAYETAVWMDPTIRSSLITAQQQQAAQRLANERAKQAVRSNVRGITSPVSKPASQGEAKGLRATIEASADEVGI